MIEVSTFFGKRVALFGLGISGLSAARALKAGGADLVVWDERAEHCQAAQANGYNVVDLANADWSEFEALILSPGVPLTHPEPHWTVVKAHEANVPVIGDTELFFLEFLARGANDKVIAITGTNGKSTTTALTTHLLKKAGCRTVMGGNIGVGVLELPDFGQGTIYVLELSSYQIDLTPSLFPTAAALLNITPDHLDRHGSVEHYADVKARVFDQLDETGRAVVSIDDAYCQAIAAELETDAQVCLVGSEGDLPQGARLTQSGFVLFENGLQTIDIDLSGARALPGKHNSQNAAFAFLLANKVCDNDEALLQGFQNFPGLEHRCQEVGRFEQDGQTIVFVNDSKATNAEASATALSSFENIYWIAGGRAKEGGIESLGAGLDQVAHAFFIGEAAQDFGQTLKAKGIAFELCGDLNTATQRAFETAKEKPNGQLVILLSPAAASFDQYANFEVRGKAFYEAINALGAGILYDDFK